MGHTVWQRTEVPVACGRHVMMCVPWACIRQAYIENYNHFLYSQI